MSVQLERDEILRLQNVTKLFPGTIALHNICLGIKKGEVHGLIGKNGAGKSTLVNLISGVIDTSYGEIFVNGQRFKSLSRMHARKVGISIVPQETPVISDLTVAETFFSPDYPCNRLGLIDWTEIYSRARDIVKRADFDVDVSVKIGDLSISTQQFLLILKTFYVEDASIIVLDEASASLSKTDQKRLYELIKNREKGKTILYISHIIREILEVCDRVSVLRDGQIISTEEVPSTTERELAQYIIGKEKAYYSNHSLRATEDKNIDKGPIFSLENLSKIGSFKNINLTGVKGQIIGLVGLRGSGRTELFKAIAGIDPPDSGTITLKNRRRTYKKPSDALNDGVVYLSEERDREGLILGLSIRHNLVISCLSRLISKFLINRKKEADLTKELIDSLEIQTTTGLQEASSLSGGNRQKVVFGKTIATRPFIFLLDEPTKGIDISTKQKILKLIKEKLAIDATILMTSPGIEELIQICDKIIVLYKGEIVNTIYPDDYNEEAIYLLMQGSQK